MKKYKKILSENFHILVVKFSIYLNRHVFVMRSAFSHVAAQILVPSNLLFIHTLSSLVLN